MSEKSDKYTENWYHLSSHKILDIVTKHYAAILFFFILFIYHKVFLTYGFADDYCMLWEAQYAKEFIPVIQGGRLIYALLAKLFFTAAHSVENLKYIRIIGLLGVWSIAITFFRYLLWLKWDRLSALFLSFLIIVTPSFAFYVSWAATFLAPWAFLCSVLACIVLLRHTENDSAIKNSLIYILTIGLVECSLFIYQPSAMAYLIPLSLYVLAKPVMSMRKITVLLGVLLFSIALYMLLFKLNLAAMGLAKLDRASLSHHLIGNILSFFIKDLKPIVRLNFIFADESILQLLTFSGYLALIIFYCVKIRETYLGKMSSGSLLFLILALPLTYLPRIVSQENWICYRTLCVTGVYLVVIYCSIIKDPIKNRAVVCLLSVIMATACYYNINNHIDLQIKEYKIVSREMKKVIKLKPEKVILVCPPWNILTSDVFADEYGLPSTFVHLVPASIMSLLVQVITNRVDLTQNSDRSIVSNQINIQVYDYNKFHEKEEDSKYPVINIGKILKSTQKSY